MGDFFSGLWTLITWPFRTICGILDTKIYVGPLVGILAFSLFSVFVFGFNWINTTKNFFWLWVISIVAVFIIFFNFFYFMTLAVYLFVDSDRFVYMFWSILLLIVQVFIVSCFVGAFTYFVSWLVNDKTVMRHLDIIWNYINKNEWVIWTLLGFQCTSLVGLLIHTIVNTIIDKINRKTSKDY
ncbi:hypothetical protein NPA07_05625 [Mycoplasmopsis caviae]|uniref:Uncharacterized protein n=1 Tax=Mycoplasmopsis caviae TaxID=55603 RepID=A0A3P8L743_9BACT|nr:hypothetical protein [Mycoplasmopsis caviae]UUD35251.1 hypothetical protein NPA07_05625 [Mycoplasmopsis caviae]VDR41965.1 Uncharacterised protein [Mycoplasmopsis caviae]